MGDKDEAKAAFKSTIRTENRKTLWVWKWFAIIVIQVEALFILLPPLDKSLAIVDNIFTLMPINIHALSRLTILPVKP